MVNLNPWEFLLGKSPKKFKKETNKQLADNTLLFLRDNQKGKWTTSYEIFDETLKETDLFNSKEGKMFFAIQGIKSKIGWVINELRRRGYPIISGTKQSQTNRYIDGKKIIKKTINYGKGYRYAGENTGGFIEDWDEKRKAWFERKSNLRKERDTDIKLMERIIERLLQKGREKEAEKLKQVLVQYQR